MQDMGEKWKLEYFSARLKDVEASIEEQERALEAQSGTPEELAILREIRELNNEQKRLR